MNCVRLLMLAIAAVGLFICHLDATTPNTIQVNPPLTSYVDARITEFDQIPADRAVLLSQLAEYITACRANEQTARLTFICTHNSRRSQMAQVWAAVSAAYFGINDVQAFSGGTERTAFNPRAVAALKRAGLDVRNQGKEEPNPRYRVSFAAAMEPLLCFSKRYDDEPNPKTEYCAVMTCSEADKACPLVAGAAKRLPISYTDPKLADDTSLESETYDERCAQIAREMLFVFSRVK